MGVYLERVADTEPEEFRLIFAGAHLQAFERAFTEDELIPRPRDPIEIELAGIWKGIFPEGGDGLQGTLREVELTATLLRACGARTEEQVARMDGGNGDPRKAQRIRSILGELSTVAANQITKKMSKLITVDSNTFADEVYGYLIGLSIE
jgi:hypothetical protein